VTHVTSSEAETQTVAAAMAASLEPGAILLLHGDLGAGKTAFVRGLASGLGIDPDTVSSPTFTIVLEYRGGRLPLFHADLYRLGSGEVDDLGLDQLGADEGVVAIEWAERLPRALPDAWHIRLAHGEGDDTRVIEIESPAMRAAPPLAPATGPEVWLRGPLPDVAPMLQPVAHALLQVGEDAERALRGLTPAQIWARPHGVASVGFHARHLKGSLDRLLTYARGESLHEAQFAFLKTEAEAGAPPATGEELHAEVAAAIDAAIAQVRATPTDTLFDPRTVGRARLPTTVFGLLVHAAEHSARHAGQMITTSLLVR
jgi:tRNA threonylcarbamoyl adenosine modification protein YjeE